jgi:AcrR family transcriptional regulator
MPRINAATVAEHRARQRAALLAAARALLLAGGWTALTFGVLATRTGIARPTVYSYFRTRDDVVVALCEAELPLVAADIERAVRRAGTPRERLAAFVRAQLRAAGRSGGDGYRIAHALVEAPLPDQTRRRIMALHRELMPSPVSLLEDLGHPYPALAAALVQSLVNAAVAAVHAGEPPHRVSRITVRAVLDGLASPDSLGKSV